MSRKRALPSLAVLVVVLLAAFALRIFRLDAQSLWWDEGISLHLATSSLAQIVTDRAGNIHPPLYFFILKGWVSLVGVTPFAARYLSVLASLVQVAVVYAVSRRWFGRSLAVWLAVLFIAISPLAVIYAQETRVYAFLPLVYLALLVLVWPLAQAESLPPCRLWWLIGIIEWIGLHLHYTTLFLVAFLNVWLLAVWLSRRRWLLLKQWLVTQTAVAAASLPWLIVLLAHRLAVQERVAIARYVTEPVNWQFLLAQIGVFHLTGLPGALARPAVQVLTLVVFAGLLLLWLWRIRDASLRRKGLHLLAFWLVPLSMALVIWQFRSFSHPRYLVIFTVGLLILLAYVMAPGGERHGRSPIITGLSWVLGGSVLAISLMGLNLYFFDPAVAKDDMRGVAHYLETAAAPDDLILVQDAGWALEFEYNGRTPITMPDIADPVEMWRRLGQETVQPRQIFTVMSATDSRDWQGVIPFALEQAGSLVAIQQFDGLVVRQYAITQPVAPPQMAAVAANFGDLQLVGAQVENDVAADTALTVALSWQVTGTVPRAYLDLRLLDVDNWPLAHKNDLLLDISGQPTDQWPSGQIVTTYHILPIPPGTPPLTYALA
ncbi:MAG: glycosyltransferase family 39 protein, partial [Anaerolineae bacterium]